MRALALTLLCSLSSLAFAQELVPEKTKLTFKEGLTFQHENDFLLRLRFRVQNRFTAVSEDAEVDKLESTEFTVRRMRLRFDGHAIDPRLLYRVQFSFTRGDQDWDNAKVPNILRDAVVGWRWLPHHTLWLGMAKLPGNRQRVISSSAQQFVDRSIVNANFNIDRDTGVQHFSQFGDERPLWLKLALTNGEGRNQPNKNASLATTARVEWYPLGAFHDDGDNFEADLYREPAPRLGLGIAHHANQETARSGGQTGKDLEGAFRSLESHFVDVVFKYRGYSFSAEYAKRTAPAPVVTPELFVFTGEGFNLQTGYLFETNWEPSARYSRVLVSDGLRHKQQDTTQYTLGLSRYIKNHVVKVQGDLSFQERPAQYQLARNDQWILRLQVELGI